jgi:hypothetical protein
MSLQVLLSHQNRSCQDPKVRTEETCLTMLKESDENGGTNRIILLNHPAPTVNNDAHY